MTKYSCNLCAYFTSNKTKYERHINSKKHTDNSTENRLSKHIDKSTCKFCGKSYSSLIWLNKHTKTCEQTQSTASTETNKASTEELSQIHDLSKNKPSMNPKNEHTGGQRLEDTIMVTVPLSTITDISRRALDTVDNTVNGSFNTVNTTVNSSLNTVDNAVDKTSDTTKSVANNAVDKTSDTTKSVANNAVDKMAEVSKTCIIGIKYISTAFSDAPSLEEGNMEIENEEVDKLIDDLIDYKKNGNLQNFFGDKIVEKYKMKNQEKQSVWASDCSRLNYIVKKGKRWVNDKNGIYVTDKIIKPMVNSVKPHVDKAQNEIYALINDGTPRNYMHRKGLASSLDELTKLQEILNNNIFSKQISRYIAPYLSTCTIDVT